MDQESEASSSPPVPKDPSAFSVPGCRIPVNAIQAMKEADAIWQKVADGRRTSARAALRAVGAERTGKDALYDSTRVVAPSSSVGVPAQVPNNPFSIDNHGARSWSSNLPGQFSDHPSMCSDDIDARRPALSFLSQRVAGCAGGTFKGSGRFRKAVLSGEGYDAEFVLPQEYSSASPFSTASYKVEASLMDLKIAAESLEMTSPPKDSQRMVRSLLSRTSDQSSSLYQREMSGGHGPAGFSGENSSEVHGGVDLHSFRYFMGPTERSVGRTEPRESEVQWSAPSLHEKLQHLRRSWRSRNGGEKGFDLA
jgi:hypothetical protein